METLIWHGTALASAVALVAVFRRKSNRSRLNSEGGFVVVAMVFVGLFALLAGAVIGARYPKVVAPASETYVLPELPARAVPRADLPPKKAPESAGSGDFQTGY